MKEFREVLCVKDGKEIELSNHKSDPMMWIIRIYKKRLFFRNTVSSYWFNGRESAEEYAKKVLGC